MRVGNGCRSWRVCLLLQKEGRSVFPGPGRCWKRCASGSIPTSDTWEKASTRRLLDQIRKRHVWLSEYFLWGGNKVDFRCPTPRLALRFAYQVGWFEERLPDHVLIIQKGLWWTLPTWTYIALREKCLGLEGISRAEGASGFLQSQRSSFDASAGNLNVRF